MSCLSCRELIAEPLPAHQNLPLPGVHTEQRDAAQSPRLHADEDCPPDITASWLVSVMSDPSAVVEHCPW